MACPVVWPSVLCPRKELLEARVFLQNLTLVCCDLLSLQESDMIIDQERTIVSGVECLRGRGDS